MPEQETDNIALYVACPSCVSFSAAESRTAGASTAESHNASRHNGDDVAETVNVRDPDELREFVHAVKEYAPGEEYTNFIEFPRQIPRSLKSGRKPTLDDANHTRWQGRLPRAQINIFKYL